MIRTYAKWFAAIAIPVAIAALIGLVLNRAYQRGYTAAEVVGQRNLAHYQLQQSQAATQAASAAFGKYTEQVTRNGAIEAGFIGQQSKQAANVAILKGNIDAVTRPRRTEPAHSPAADGNRCVFSGDFVRLWNAAAESGTGDRALPASTAAGVAPDATRADAAACSGVSPADILDWFIDYAARSHGVEHQLNAVLDAVPDGE